MVRSLTRTSLLTIALVILLLPSACALYFYAQYRELAADPAAVIRKETETILSAVSAFMALPDEEPSIATVLERDKLANEPFFRNAENGDKLIVYYASRKVILYRPSQNKVIEVAALAEDDEETNP